jgi:hypothetical protein
LDIDSRPAGEVVGTGQLGMPPDVEMPTTARSWCLHHRIEANAEPVEHLSRPTDIATVARVHIDHSDLAAHHAQDRLAGSPLGKLG